MKERKKFFTPVRKEKIRVGARSFIAGVELSTALFFGPRAVRATSDVIIARDKKGAVAEGRKNLSYVSTHDLTHTGETTERRNGVDFKSGGTPPNESNAIGRVDYAEGRLRAADAPIEVVEPQVQNIKDLISVQDPGYKQAKDAINRFDKEVLIPYQANIQSQIRKKTKEAFANAAKGGGVGAAWVAGETAWAIRRRRKNSRANTIVSTGTDEIPQVKELLRVNPISPRR